MSQENGTSPANSSADALLASIQPMGLRDILVITFVLYRDYFRLFISICAIFFVIISGLDMLEIVLLNFFASDNQWNIVIAINIIAGLVALVVTYFIMGGLVLGSAQTYLGKSSTVLAVFGQSKRRFFPFIGCVLLVSFAVWILAITIIGFPVAIFLGIRWMFCVFAVLIEENSVINSLKRSSELVKGSWWRVFGVMLVISILSIFAHIILLFPFLFILGFTESLSGDGNILDFFQGIFNPELPFQGGLGTYMILSSINNFLTSFIWSIALIGLTVLYFDMRIRKRSEI